jgi:hypothetical protein
MPSLADNEEHWLRRAAESRALADALDDPEMRQSMLDIADQYLKLAVRARERIEQEKKDAE